MKDSCLNTKVKRQRLVCAVLVCLLGIAGGAGPVGADAFSSGPVDLLVNNRFVEPPVPPYLQSGSLMVPLRAVFAPLGVEVRWDGPTQVATLYKDGLTVVLQSGNQSAWVGEMVYPCLPAPTLRSGTLMVPIRAVAGFYGIPVEWIPELNMVVYGRNAGIRLQYQKGPDGTEFLGELSGGMRNGFGLQIWSDGSRYEGMWLNGLYHGYGVYRYADGSRYEGDFLRGKRHGTGVHTGVNGLTTFGNWFEDRLTTIVK